LQEAFRRQGIARRRRNVLMPAVGKSGLGKLRCDRQW